MIKETKYTFENAEEIILALRCEYPFQNFSFPDDLALVFRGDEVFFTGTNQENFVISSKITPFTLIKAMLNSHGMDFIQL